MHRHARTLARTPALAALVLLLAGCVGAVATPAPPTPSDFAGVVAELAREGIVVSGVVAGDAGCSDPALAPTAISFRASGLDQTLPVGLYLYVFGSRASYEKLRSSVDACARTYVSDTSTFEALDPSPFVLAGQGPWGPSFRDALRAGLTRAAGDGG